MHVVGVLSRVGEVKVAAHAILAEPCLAGNEEAWDMPVAKFSPEDHAAVSTATAVAVSKNATEVREEENSPPWRPGEKYAPPIIRYHQLPQRSVERRK